MRAIATGAGRRWERGRHQARLGPRPAQRHILRLMPERPPNAAWLKLGAEPGLSEPTGMRTDLASSGSQTLSHRRRSRTIAETLPCQSSVSQGREDPHER